MSTDDEDQLDRSGGALSATIATFAGGGKAKEDEAALNDRDGSIRQDTSAPTASNTPDNDVEKAAGNGVEADVPVDEYPHGIKLAMLLLSIYLSVFLVALDRTIIATALPQITDHFKSFADIGWVSQAYSPRKMLT